jgi:hypothetical protein
MVFCLLNSCMGQVTVFRHSADYSQLFIYLGKDIAISKATQPKAFDESKTYFSIGKAHWAGEPELAQFTGDAFYNDIESNPEKIGISADNQWLIVKGKKYNESKQQYDQIIHVVRVETGENWANDNVTALQNDLKGRVDLQSIKMEPVEVFFDRMLITYLKTADDH